MIFCDAFVLLWYFCCVFYCLFGYFLVAEKNWCDIIKVLITNYISQAVFNLLMLSKLMAS